MCTNYPEKDITWIFPEDNNTIGVGEALVPDVSHFLQNLNINHQDIINHCGGSLKLGIRFEDFNKEGESFTFPFGVGESVRNSSLIDHIMNTHNIPTNIWEYDDISVHLRTTDSLQFLDPLFDDFNNITIRREIVSLEDLTGTYDLVIDCTGFGRHISKRDNNFKSIKDIIPNNKAYSYRHPYTNEEKQLVPFSTFKAMDYGWVWNIPLKNQLAMGYVHDDKYDVKDDFVKYIEDKLNTKINPDDIDEIPMLTGRNNIHLNDNIVAIGLSSAFIEPLESTGLYLVTSALTKLCKYIDGYISEDEYNTSINNEYDVIVDFIAAHYKFSSRDNDYWNHYKNLDIDINGKIDIFPQEAWDYILSGFLKTVSRPKEKTTNAGALELIKIHNGTPYCKWIKDESNFK